MQLNYNVVLFVGFDGSFPSFDADDLDVVGDGGVGGFIDVEGDFLEFLDDGPRECAGATEQIVRSDRVVAWLVVDGGIGGLVHPC